MNLSYIECGFARKRGGRGGRVGIAMLCILLLTIPLPGCGGRTAEEHAANGTEQESDSLVFRRGKEAVSEHYTGRIFITAGIHKSGYDINHLVFEPGSHNDWHIHPAADQLMLVLDGEGYYQEEGKPKRLVRKGDVVDTPANVKHWHGATPGTRLVHLSVTDRTDKGHIRWMEAVDAEEYHKPVQE